MKPKSAIKKLKPLLKAPTFSTAEAKGVGVSAATLAHYVKCGELERVSRGIYRAPDAPKVQDFRWQDLVETVQGINGGVVCLTSALALYDLTEEIPRQHWIAIRNETVHRAAPSTRIVRMRDIKLGQTEIKIDGISVPIFDRERTIIDSFRYLSRETAIKALKRALSKRADEKLDLEKLRKYAKALRFKIEPYLLAVTT